MKTVLGCIRRADEDFSLIGDGDRIAVGVSGGKDSLLLLYALSLYRRFSHKNFALSAITLDMGLRPFDVSGIRALCERIEVPYTVVQTQIAQVIFDIRKAKWQLVVDTHNPNEPALRYEAGFMITAQSRSFLMLMSAKKPKKPMGL